MFVPVASVYSWLPSVMSSILVKVALIGSYVCPVASVYSWLTSVMSSILVKVWYSVCFKFII